MLENKNIEQNEQETYNIDVERNPTVNSPPEGNISHLINKPTPAQRNVSYLFRQGRHSGSFYLKLGATAFAIGHLIHSVLLIAAQSHNEDDKTYYNDNCFNKMGAIHDIINPLFTFLELYFIFNYSNIIILKGQGLAHFGFMHLMASSICFWISTIYRETLLALIIYANSKYRNTTVTDHRSGKHDHKSLLDLESLYDKNCHGSPSATVIFENFSPYLFPFGVEFNILIVAFYYTIWSNIGNGCKDEIHGICATEHQVASRNHYNEPDTDTGNLEIHINCHASSKVFGLVLVVCCSANLIIGFVLGNLGGEFLEHGYTVNERTKLGMHTLMTIAVIIAYMRTRKLDVTEHPISLLDDVFLYICLPAFFVETLLSLVATINILNIVKSLDLVLMTLQVIIQTSFLIDGLRRCSNSKKLKREKPGRDVVMFLLIANVCMWLFNTFSYKSPDSIDERYEYYEKFFGLF